MVLSDTGLRADLVAKLLRPRSVAIIGFSAKPGAMGATALSLLERDRFAGEIHLVGRIVGEHGGRPVLASPAHLPPGVDLAVLALPAAGVADALTACISRGIGSVVIFAAGFAETGEEGRTAQAALGALAERSGVGIAGPNCLGFANYVDGLEISFLPGPVVKPMPASAKPGVAIVVHSGGLMGHLLWALQAHGVPIAYQISTGNEADLGLSDYIAFLVDDPAVAAIAIYAEYIRRPDAFLAAVGRARAAGKPVVMLHTGRSRKAQTAAASHTGALAGDHAVMRAVVERAGVLVVDTVEELIDCTEFLSRYPAPPRGQPAIATTSGAMCAISHDTCDDVGLHLAALSKATLAGLREILPAFITPDNPCDLGPLLATDPTILPAAGHAILADPAVGSLVVITPVGAESIAVRWIPGAIELTRASNKPVVLGLMGDDHPLPASFAAMAIDAGLLMFRSPERALRAVARMAANGQCRDRGVDADAGKPFPGIPALPAGTLAEWRGKAVLTAIGVPVPAGGLASNADAAVAVAARIGYPVALKIQSATLIHKTEIGGVLLGLTDEAALRSGCELLFERAARIAPDAVLDGLLVETMSARGVELVIGAKRDPNWGPVIMIGLGGVMVEALDDVRLLPPDLDGEAIIGELGKLKSARLLGAFRGRPPRDLQAVAATVAAIGRLMTSRPDIVEIDVNPLVALAEGDGVIALDALIVTG